MDEMGKWKQEVHAGGCLGLEIHSNVGSALGYMQKPESTDLKRVHNK